MKKIITCLFLMASLSATAQKSEGLKAITQNAIEGKLAFIASDLLEGREAGERGGFIAAEYIASKFCELGLTPYNAEDKGILSKYMQPFKAIRVTPKGATINVNNDGVTSSYQDGTDFSYTFANQSMKITGDLVKFDGTGDCKGKIVVIDSEDSKDLIKKAMTSGASAILCYNEAQNDKQIATKAFEYHVNETMYEGFKPRKLFKDTKLVLDNAKAVTPMFNISKRVYDNILADSKVSIKINAKTEPKYLRNVIGCIEGEIADEYVVMGSHYDHYGIQDGYIYNGADDNGSGVVALMQIAEAMVKSGVKPKRTVVFALWDAEERGLFGSRHYVSQVQDKSSIKGYINFDMIGRGSKPQNYQSVSYMYTESTPQFADILKSNIKESKLPLKTNYAPNKRPVGGSDNSSFAEVDIPIAWFLTGGHPDYHQPSDSVEKINMEKVTNVARAAYLLLYDYANQE